MLKVKNTIFAVLFALILISFQELLIFGTVMYDGIKQLYFYVVKIALTVIYFALIRMLLDSYIDFKMKDENFEKNSTCFEVFALILVFSFSSTVINCCSAIFDVIFASTALLSFTFSIYFMEKGQKDAHKKEEN